MSRSLKVFLSFLFLVTLSGFSIGGIFPQNGGEIPWPLSRQRVVTVSNSQGLWKLNTSTSTYRMFNVEIESDSRSGTDWIRVAELDTKTFQVVSWGDGYFITKNSEYPGGSSFSEVSLNPSLSLGDKTGRYITMYPFGKMNKKPFLLRMVEVKTSIGHVLGLSILNRYEKSAEHFLGSRVLEEPMFCFEDKEKTAGLSCSLHHQ